MMGNLPPTYPRYRWHQSLIVRVMVLCGVLVVCLLGSVYQITSHYVHEMVQEMETQTRAIAIQATLYSEDHPDSDRGELEKQMRDRYKGTGTEIKFPVVQGDATLETIDFKLERMPDGHLTKVARMPMAFGDKKALLEVREPVVAMNEILRAFSSRYFALLGMVFVVTLGLMIYSISRILRPLTELSGACAHIISGKLENVAVKKTSGEVQALEYTFNQMVSSLQEKEKIEANLRQAQRLSAIGNLAAGVAHDIRNPLNAIKLISSHAIDVLDDVPQAQSTINQLHTIRNEVDRLEDIVSQFLSLAKERELQPEPNQIDLLLSECVRLVRKDAEARGIRLVTALQAGNTSLLVDAKQLTRAILNVLINAMEVCPEGGRVRLFSRVTDTTCEIEVRDDGPGMSPEVAERAFEPYFTTKSTGTGLGLSITRGIIEEHGGTINLSSSEEQGTQVLITLPLQATPVYQQKVV